MEQRFVQRIQSLKEQAQQNDVDCVAFIPGTNLFYLTGIDMHLSERASMLLIPVDGEPAWFAPRLEFAKLTELSGIRAGRSWADEKGPQGPLETLANELGWVGKEKVTFACEDRNMRLLEWDLLQGVLPQAERVDAGALMAPLRQVKDASELTLMERAVDIAQEALERARQALQTGITERQLANAIRHSLLELGSPAAFGPSVAFGSNTGNPHSQVSDRVLEEGDLVWIDMGAVVEGYCSDITRTFVVGEPGDELRRAYDTVYRAQRAARENAAPGMTAGEVDELCRDIIAAEGFGEQFIHRTGHGLGLDVHEEPYIVGGSEVVLRSGMVFTIEPGIYLPGIGGVRIEDDVVVTADGVRSLTTYKRYWL